MTLKRTAFKPREPSKEPKRRVRKCIVCRDQFEPRSMTHKACKPECAALHVVAEKVRKDRRERQEGLAKLKRRADYIKEAQVAFNRFIRERDRLTVCISCNVYLPSIAGQPGGAVDCGHYRSVGSAPHMRFHEQNAHGQCKKCNRYRSGNAIEYRRILLARIGLQAVEALEADDTPRKWTIDDLKAIRAHYTDKYKQLLRAG